MPTRHHPLCLFILVGAVIIASMGGALGQEEAGDGRDLRKAQAYLTLAGDLFRSQDYRGALAELQRAEPLVVGSEVHPLIRFNIARCFEELGRPGEAYNAYARYLELVDEKTTRRAKAVTAIERLRRDAFGTLRVTCAQPGTTLVVPGLGKAPRQCPFEQAEVMVGEYVLAAALTGHSEATQTVAVQGGQVTTVRFDLVPTTVVEAMPVTSDSGGLKWVAFGGGLGAGLAGVVFHVTALDNYRTHDRTTVTGVEARDEIVDEFVFLRTLTYTAYALSAVFLGAGYYLSTQSSPTPDTVSVSAGPTGMLIRF